MNLKLEELNKELEKAKDLLIVVEGIKDKHALEKLGFKNIFVINENNKSLNEKIEQLEEVAGKNKICILTDFDKKGKSLYLKLKSELAGRNVRLDNKFRAVLLNLKISHIEGLASFIENEQKY